MLKIDFHVHVTPPDIIAGWQKYAEKEPYFSLLSKNPGNKFAQAEDIIAALDTSRFDRAVIFGFAFKDSGLCRYVNDYVIEKTRQFPQRLIGFISVPSGAGASGSRELEKEIDRCCSAGLCGIGELYPGRQGINIDNKKETRALTGACMERDLPLILHVNEPVGHYYIGKNDVALNKIEKFIENTQTQKKVGLRVILAHWGGGLFLYEAMPGLQEKFCNVYYDTAAMPFLYDERIYRAAKALNLCDKILFGSDFPLLPQMRYMDGLEKSGFSFEEKMLVLGRNAEKVLGLADGELM